MSVTYERRTGLRDECDEITLKAKVDTRKRNREGDDSV